LGCLEHFHFGVLNTGGFIFHCLVNLRKLIRCCCVLYRG